MFWDKKGQRRNRGPRIVSVELAIEKRLLERDRRRAAAARAFRRARTGKAKRQALIKEQVAFGQSVGLLFLKGPVVAARGIRALRRKRTKKNRR